MLIVLLPVSQIKLGERHVTSYHQHVLRVLVLRSLSEVETAGNQSCFRAAGINHHHFTVGAGVIGIEESWNACGCDPGDYAGGNFLSLLLVGNRFHIYPTASGCDQRFDNSVMGEAECLHLTVCAIDDIRDQLAGIIPGREGNLYRTGGGGNGRFAAVVRSWLESRRRCSK